MESEVPGADPIIDRIIQDLQRQRQELEDSGRNFQAAELLERIAKLRQRIEETPSPRPPRIT